MKAQQCGYFHSSSTPFSLLCEELYGKLEMVCPSDLWLLQPGIIPLVLMDFYRFTLVWNDPFDSRTTWNTPDSSPCFKADSAALAVNDERWVFNYKGNIGSFPGLDCLYTLLTDAWHAHSSQLHPALTFGTGSSMISLMIRACLFILSLLMHVTQKKLVPFHAWRLHWWTRCWQHMERPCIWELVTRSRESLPDPRVDLQWLAVGWYTC